MPPLPETPPRTALAALPTPLRPLPRLSAATGGADVWIKRDDLTGLELSGNKVRKLEFILADAIASGCDCLISVGAPQSNHCRATAAACARLGIEARLLLRPRPPAGPRQGNLLLDHAFGARIFTFDREDFEARRETIIREAIEQARRDGRSPRFTPMGASEPLGCWGYLEGVRELAGQLDAAGIRSCDVVIAVSSGGTWVGAALGVALLGLSERIRLHGVAVSDDFAHHRRVFAELCHATITRFNLPVGKGGSQFGDGLPVPALLDGYIGPGYARSYPAAVAAARQLARLEAILLDPVYTAKAFCALLDEVRAGRMGRERPVIFWHTGGIFSNFAWPELVDWEPGHE